MAAARDRALANPIASRSSGQRLAGRARLPTRASCAAAIPLRPGATAARRVDPDRARDPGVRGTTRPDGHTRDANPGQWLIQRAVAVVRGSHGPGRGAAVPALSADARLSRGDVGLGAVAGRLVAALVARGLAQLLRRRFLEALAQTRCPDLACATCPNARGGFRAASRPRASAAAVKVFPRSAPPP